ncbi:MAG: hypothetical protein AB1644_09165 [Candidatus Zixiibacteriota bacterium]
MGLKFDKSTDTAHKVKLESQLVDASWLGGVAYAGQKAAFRVQTAFVGSGASIQMTGKSEKGKKLGKVKDTIVSNSYIGSFDIPADLEPGDKVYFEVELSKHGLKGESDLIPVRPCVTITNMKWSANEARRGDVLTLSADIRGVVDDTEAKVTVYEYDRDSIHDKIAELKGVVKSHQLRLDWAYQYFEDTDEIPTEQELQKYGRGYNPPEYFFTITVGDEEFGKKQESGLLEFKDFLEIRLVDKDGKPKKDEPFTVTLPDGTTKDGQLDARGYARLDDVPPGRCTIKFKNVKGVQQIG